MFQRYLYLVADQRAHEQDSGETEGLKDIARIYYSFSTDKDAALLEDVKKKKSSLGKEKLSTDWSRNFFGSHYNEGLLSIEIT